MLSCWMASTPSVLGLTGKQEKEHANLNTTQQGLPLPTRMRHPRTWNTLTSSAVKMDLWRGNALKGMGSLKRTVVLWNQRKTCPTSHKRKPISARQTAAREQGIQSTQSCLTNHCTRNVWLSWSPLFRRQQAQGKAFYRQMIMAFSASQTGSKPTLCTLLKAPM